MTAPPLDEENPRCREHRHFRPGQMLDKCWRCDEVAKWAESKRAERVAVVAAVLRDCVMCDRGGQRWDPATHVAVSPLRSCDHVTAHEVVVAELVAAEAVLEARWAAGRVSAPIPSSSAVRDAARASFRTATARRRTVTRPAVSSDTDRLEEKHVAVHDRHAAVAS